MVSDQDYVVICTTCRERLEYKMYYAREHKQKYPDHTKYIIVHKSDEDIN